MAKIYVTAVINAPVDRAWEAIRDFNALPQWHPFIEASRIEDDLLSATVGCIRNFQLKDNGGTIREQLVTLSDVERLCTYSILESPMPVENYVATVRLLEITESNASLGEWQAEFDVPSAEESETVALVTSVFQEGFKNLDQLLAG